MNTRTLIQIFNSNLLWDFGSSIVNRHYLLHKGICRKIISPCSVFPSLFFFFSFSILLLCRASESKPPEHSRHCNILRGMGAGAGGAFSSSQSPGEARMATHVFGLHELPKVCRSCRNGPSHIHLTVVAWIVEVCVCVCHPQSQFVLASQIGTRRAIVKTQNPTGAS